MKTIKFLCYSIALASGAVSMTSCSSDDGGGSASLPPIGGYNSADEIATADLLAYWPLDGNGVEKKSSTSPSTQVGQSWEAGIKGQGVKLSAGYMRYPHIAALTGTLNSFTVTAWVKVKNNQETTASASTFFSLSRPNEWIGNMNLYAETGRYKSVTDAGVVNDTIMFKGGWGTTTDGNQIYESLPKLEQWMIDDNVITPGKHVANANKVGGQWAQAVFTWNGATKTFIVYSNGKKISNPAFEVRGENTTLTLDASNFAMIGAFGNHATTTDSWNKPMTGNIDEIRVYKKALSAADINSLYELEKAGR